MTQRQPIELIDWSKRHPKETARTIAIRQSTMCLCGSHKSIGDLGCFRCELVSKGI